MACTHGGYCGSFGSKDVCKGRALQLAEDGNSTYGYAGCETYKRFEEQIADGKEPYSHRMLRTSHRASVTYGNLVLVHSETGIMML